MQKKNCSTSFSDASDSSGIEEITKQINMLKPLDIEPCKASRKIELVISFSANVNVSVNQ